MQKKRNGNILPDEGIGRYLRFAIFPVVVLLLIVVIIKADSDTSKETEPIKTTEPASAFSSGGPSQTKAETEPPTETASVSETEPVTQPIIEAEVSQYSLKQDEVLELLELVQAYCKAKKDCDPEALGAVFGKSEMTEEELSEEREKMELVKASVKGYQNISCYSIEGPEEDSYVMFPYFELQYRGVETFVPVLTWAYGKKAGNGQYIMTQEVSKEVAEYIRKVGEREDVKALISQVKKAREEAVASEEKLKEIYGISGESQITIGQKGEENSHYECVGF